jgi:hypothetical protein
MMWTFVGVNIGLILRQYHMFLFARYQGWQNWFKSLIIILTHKAEMDGEKWQDLAEIDSLTVSIGPSAPEIFDKLQ